MNDPFASVCRACGARNAFGQSAYEEPVAPPPTGRTRSSESYVRWAVAFAAVAVSARLLLWCIRASSARHQAFVQPIELPPITIPTASAMTLAAAAKLPPARRFALTDDGRAVAFDGDRLKVHTSGGTSHEVADVTGPLGPRADSPLVVSGDSAYWIAAGDGEIAAVRLLDWKPVSFVKGVHAIGALDADDKSIWYTASDGKATRKLFRVDVTVKPTPVLVASWSSTRTNELMIVTDAAVLVVEPAAIARIAKSNGRATTLVTLTAQEELGAIATSADTLYFTTGAAGEPAHELYRVPLEGGDRTKVLTSPGGIGDVVVSDKDIVIADRPNVSWQVDSLPGGDVAQITIVASDVGRQPRLRASSGHTVWSTNDGIAFSD